MQKQPFDENGLQSLLLALYALPDQQLIEEAAALKHHPILWINGHFDLDEHQLNYLENMPSVVLHFIAEDGSFAIGHRLPITLNKVYDTAEDDDKEQDKVFKPKSNLSVQTDNEGNVTAGGDFEIEVTYINSTND